MSAQKFLDLPPLLNASGVVHLPGSKSISNRMLLLAALSSGVTEIHDLLLADDTERMLDGLRILGVRVESQANNVYLVHGCGGKFPVKNAKLFLGNAGTALRPLTAALALAGGQYQLSGVSRMHERPIADLVDALRTLGADIRYLGKEGFPPLEIHPAEIHGGECVSVRSDLSSQFLTALLLALPLLPDATRVQVSGELISKPYIEITLKLMAKFGVNVTRDGWHSFTIHAGSHYVAPGVIHVESDASSASYFLAAGAIGGGPLRIEGVGRDSIQGDIRFAEALEKMGAHIEMGANWIEARSPDSGKLSAIDLDCNHIPDAAMTLAVIALFAEGVTVLRNIASWRVKETDRIHAMATELRKFGAVVEEGVDFLRIAPAQTPISAPLSSIDTYDDHRMAMCFSLTAFYGTSVRINDPNCVAKTFPDYFEYFARVTKTVPVIAIDGPSASGKGTVAQMVAEKLGYHFLDSGSLYRLLALSARQQGVALDAESQLAALARRMNLRFEGKEIWLDGRLVGNELRSEQCAMMASRVAKLPAVREALSDRQRAFRRAPGLVADGRDMATVVFPDAELKVFMTASAEARAERRHNQLMEKGIGLSEKGMNANITDLLRDIRARDEQDSQRKIAPLHQAVGAGLLDTTHLTIEQAVQEVLLRYRAISK